MRDEMAIGDLALFYHSNAKPPGVAGIAKVASRPYPDALALDKKSEYYDPSSSEENPRWMLVDFAFVEEFKELLSLEELKEEGSLSDMLILRKGNRLSITPVEEKHFKMICKLANFKSK